MGKFKLKKLLFMSSATSSYETKDERNVVSWRVPNVPKQPEVSEDTELSIKSKDQLKSTSTDKASSTKSDSAPSSPIDGRKGQKSPKTFSDPSTEEPKNNFGNKLWRMLFSNVIRSIDDVYVQCEEQEDKAKCQEVIELLVRSRNDFKKLSARLDEQSRFQIGQAMSWEIRKPTLPSPMNPASAEQTHYDLSVLEREYDERQTAGSAADTGDGPDRKPAAGDTAAPTSTMVPSAQPTDATPKKLNAAAKPFSPALTSLVAGPSTPVASKKAASKDAAEVPAIVLPSTASLTQPAQPAEPTVSTKASAASASPTSPTASPSPPKLVLPPPARIPAPPGLRRATSGTASDLFGKNRSNSNVSLSKEKPEKVDDWSDRRLQMEVQQASEKVWAAAEAWVEAEAEAEEQEWQLLALGINSYLREAGALSDEEEDPEGAILGLRSPMSSHNSPKQFPGMGLGLLPGDATWEGNFVALSPEQRAIWEQTPPSRYGAGKTLAGASLGLSRSRAASRTNLAAAALAPAPSAVLQVPAAASAAPLSTPVAAGKSRKTAGIASSAATQAGMSILTGTERTEDRVPEPSSGGSPGSSRRASSAYDYRSPSESPTEDYFASGVSSTAASGGRSLHDKLSSPDRKKSISPSEALRRYEERLSNAESNRDQSIAERVQKAQIASERVRAREQREALRKATVLTAIEAKQRNVEERRNQFLKSIRSRANNETTKVHEVNLTNALNSEIIAQRLEEVETRIMAASVRRLDGLDQKRKNARKVAELSEWRLQFEKEKSERWEKLQQRLQTVKDRRAARLLELQRRAEDETRRVAGEGPSGAPVPQEATAAVKESGDIVKTAVPSRSVAGADTGAVATAATASAPVLSVTQPTALPSAVRVPRSSTPTGLRLAAALRSGGVPAPSASIRRLQASTSATATAALMLPSTAGTDADTVQTPTAATSAEQEPVAEPEAEAAAQRSKAREKKEKRKLKAQLIEMAREADIAALQEAIALNAAAAGTSSSVTVASASIPADNVQGQAAGKNISKGISKKSAGSLAFPDVSHPEAGEIYVTARHHLGASPAQCTEEGWEAWRQLASKKINVTARTDVARYCAEDVRCNAFSQEAPTLPSATAFDPAYTAPVAETLLLSALNNGGVTNGTLAHVVRDLVTAAKRARAGEAVASALTLHVMQRLYVLLQNPPASPSGGEKSEATFIAAQRSEVMQLRLMLGPEVGLLRDRGELQSAFDALTLLLFSRRELHQSAATQSSRAAGQTGSATLTDLGVVATMELEVRAEVWKLLLDALDACTESPAAVAMCLQCGLGTVLVDLLQSLLGVLDSHRRVKGSEDASVPSAVMLVSTTLLRAVARLLAYTAEVSATSASAASQQTLDALVWYVFTLGQVPLLVDGLRLRLQSWQEHGAAEAPRAESGRNGEHIATSVDFLIASAEYLGAVSDFLRSSGISGGTVVDSPLQLSPAHHRHSKGRQMVSILRRAEVGSVLLDLSALVAGNGCLSAGESAPAVAAKKEAVKVAFVDHAVLLSKLCAALASLSGADLTLAQFAHTPEQQAQWASAVGSIFSVLHTALESANQTLLPGTYEGCYALVLSRATPVLFGKTELEDALRCLLTSVTLACLRNPSLQKVCGAVAPASNSLFYVEGGRGLEVEGVRAQASLLRGLCGLTSKYYRDKKFKHSLLPCLTALCLDCDANILLLYRQEKLPFVLKYLEQSAKTREIYLQQQAKRRGEEGGATAGATASTTEEALYVQRLSRLLPTELWSVALVTFSAPAPAEGTAK